MKRQFEKVATVVLIIGLTLAFSMPAGADEAGRLDLGPGNELGTTIDRESGGAVKITARGPSTICLGVVDRPRVSAGKLVYEARVRTEGLKGRAFLEMWCVFPKGGRFFSRGLQDAASGDQAWRTLRTPFLLKQGQEPKTVVLSVVVFGEGTVWVKEPRLVMVPDK